MTTTPQRLAAHFGLTAARRPGARIDTCLGNTAWEHRDELRGFLRVHGVGLTDELESIAAVAYHFEVEAYFARLEALIAEVSL